MVIFLWTPRERASRHSDDWKTLTLEIGRDIHRGEDGRWEQAKTSSATVPGAVFINVCCVRGDGVFPIAIGGVSIFAQHPFQSKKPFSDKY